MSVVMKSRYNCAAEAQNKVRSVVYRADLKASTSRDSSKGEIRLRRVTSRNELGGGLHETSTVTVM